LDFPALANSVHCLSETLEWPSPTLTLCSDAEGDQGGLSPDIRQTFGCSPSVALSEVDIQTVIAYGCAQAFRYRKVSQNLVTNGAGWQADVVRAVESAIDFLLGRARGKAVADPVLRISQGTKERRQMFVDIPAWRNRKVETLAPQLRPVKNYRRQQSLQTHRQP
jgi:hypothetical protein